MYLESVTSRKEDSGKIYEYLELYYKFYVEKVFQNGVNKTTYTSEGPDLGVVWTKHR